MCACGASHNCVEEWWVSALDNGNSTHTCVHVVLHTIVEKWWVNALDNGNSTRMCGCEAEHNCEEEYRVNIGMMITGHTGVKDWQVLCGCGCVMNVGGWIVIQSRGCFVGWASFQPAAVHSAYPKPAFLNINSNSSCMRVMRALWRLCFVWVFVIDCSVLSSRKNSFCVHTCRDVEAHICACTHMYARLFSSGSGQKLRFANFHKLSRTLRMPLLEIRRTLSPFFEFLGPKL